MPAPPFDADSKKEIYKRIRILGFEKLSCCKIDLMKLLLVALAFVILIGSEILKVYYIMPFPGSQRDETITLAYFLNQNILYFRVAGWLLLLYSLFSTWGTMSVSIKVIIGIFFSVYLFVLILFNFYFLADKMFYQPSHKIFASASDNKVDARKLVVGVSINGESKAYPIEIIGYHHQVRDTVGGKGIMVTYCTVCRTGRVYDPTVDGRNESFRLVGMDHFNAMFEDNDTKSWWRQADGKAIVGKEKGKQLMELPSEQMTLLAWLRLHPDSKVMQPDSAYQLGYEGLQGFDNGTIGSNLEHRDSLSWKDKSWIVGIQIGKKARAYDWNELFRHRVINDTLDGTPILIALQNDSATFHVWERDTLTFSLAEAANYLIDSNTVSTWNMDGECVSGSQKGRKLPSVQSYQEFWHSWKTFHPHTTRYQKSND